MKFEMKHAVLKGIVALFAVIIIIATCARSDVNGNEYSNAIAFSDNDVSKFVSRQGIELALYSSSVIVETGDDLTSIIKYDRFEPSDIIRIITTVEPVILIRKSAR